MADNTSHLDILHSDFWRDYDAVYRRREQEKNRIAFIKADIERAEGRISIAESLQSRFTGMARRFEYIAALPSGNKDFFNQVCGERMTYVSLQYGSSLDHEVGKLRDNLARDELKEVIGEMSVHVDYLQRYCQPTLYIGLSPASVVSAAQSLVYLSERAGESLKKIKKREKEQIAELKNELDVAFHGRNSVKVVPSQNNAKTGTQRNEQGTPPK